MLKLEPALKDYIWGGYKLKEFFGRDNGGRKISESWEVSVHPDGESMTSGGTLKDYLASHESAVDPCGGELPILIKYIDAAQNLSVQVHPSDEYAEREENDNGKTEAWYIVQADDGAGIYCGFKRDTTKEEFLNKVSDGTVEELLNFIPVKAGDCYLIEAGTVHAIGAGCVICEIQQSSNVTYRVYDYGRRDAQGNARPLHVEKAVDVINFGAYRDATHGGAYESVAGGRIRLLTECKYFKCRELLLDGEFCEKNDDSFVAVNVLSGAGECGGVGFTEGDSFFVPCGEKYTIKGSGKIILSEKHVPKYYAGIDLGGTFIKCGIVDENGKVLIKDKTPTLKERRSEEIARDMADLVLRLCGKLNIYPKALAGVGVGSPGSVDSESGTIVYSNNIAWKDVPLGKLLSERLNMPVSVTNDANAAALGESFCGAGKNYGSMILVTLGTGVGGGIVLGGELFEGYRSAGAEVGHALIKHGGERCTCGRRGCFEAYASATALIRQARQAMKKHAESLLWELCGGDDEKVDGKMVFDAVHGGDKTAETVLKKYVGYLAAGLADLANIFRPEIILLGGGISEAGETLFAPLRKEFDSQIYGGSEYAPVLLGLATLGNDAGLCGAARLAMIKAGGKN